MSNRKSLGILGGLGPMASSYFYELLTKNTKARTDQEHIEAILFSCPSIPDRTSFILGKSEKNPLPQLIQAGNALDRLGVSYIAIPCVTVHYFYDTLSRHIQTPIIHLVTETVQHMKSQGIQRAGIMATDGTIQTGLFQAALQQVGIKPVIPSKTAQKCVMDLIYQHMKANRDIPLSQFNAVSDELLENGAERIILACTDLSIMGRSHDFVKTKPYVDTLEILAKKALRLCGAEVEGD